MRELYKKSTMHKCKRTIYRHEYEGIVEKVIQKTIINSKAYNRRNQIVEHPYGTIKRYFGYTYFSRKGLANVNAEVSSFCFAYNLKRLLNIFSTQKIVTKINDIMKDNSTFVFLFLKKAFFTLLSAKIAINTKNQTNCETA